MNHLTIDVGVIGRDLIATMTPDELNAFHEDMEVRQYHRRDMQIDGMTCQVSFQRRGERMQVTVRREQGGFILTEEVTGTVEFLVTLTLPQLMADSLIGKVITDVVSPIHELPCLERLEIKEAVQAAIFLIMKGDPDFQPYSGTYTPRP